MPKKNKAQTAAEYMKYISSNSGFSINDWELLFLYYNEILHRAITLPLHAPLVPLCCAAVGIRLHIRLFCIISLTARSGR